MHSQRVYDLSDCSEYRQTLMARPPGFVRASVLFLIALVVAAILWAAFTEADLVVRAQGRVRPMMQSAQQPDAAAEESKISPLRGGRVVAVHVQEGDQVRKGDLLIRLDTEQLDNDIAKRKQAIRAGEKELLRLDQTDLMAKHRFEAAKAKAEAELTVAQEELKSAKQKQQSAIKLAEGEVQLADDDLRRMQRLVATRAIADAEYMRAKARSQKARLELQQARLPSDEGRLLVLRHALQLVEREYGVERTELASRRELKRSEGETNRLELAKQVWERKQSELRAPSDGTATSLTVRVGDVVEAGRAVVAVAEQRGFRLDVAVTSDAVGLLRVGMPVRIKLDAYDFQKYGTVAGRVLFVSPDSAVQPDAAQRAPTYTVRIAIDGDHVGHSGQQGHIKLGMTGVVEIITGRESILSLLVRSIRQSISLG